MAEIIELKDVLRARARRREHELTVRCLEILEECLTSARVAYDDAPLREHLAWAVKVRQLEDLVEYVGNLL